MEREPWWQTPHPNGSSQRHRKPQPLLFSFCRKRTTSSHFLPGVRKTCGGELSCNVTEKYWTGQEVHSGFSVTSYGNTRTNFLAHPVPLGCYKLPRFGSVGTNSEPLGWYKGILSWRYLIVTGWGRKEKASSLTKRSSFWEIRLLYFLFSVDLLLEARTWIKPSPNTINESQGWNA